MLGKKVILKVDTDTKIFLAFTSLFGFFFFMIFIAQIKWNKEHYWDVVKAKSSCEYDFQSKASFVKNISSSDCSLVGQKITDYEIAKEIEYCNTDCSKVKEKYLYWQQWEKSCSNITHANGTCHQLTDIALNHYHF